MIVALSGTISRCRREEMEGSMIVEELLHIGSILAVSGLLLGLRVLLLSVRVAERRTSNGQRCKD